ncbi:FAD-dependent oxidoreductase [Brevundimonas sp.]|uniref:FAD-dependent oxidoreductase n=1 Tax=Brevundimonas sp. TaxID=1871086 RepID=UPI003918CDF1
MSTGPRDIAVVGAGPSGLATALMLARQGRRVVVHERFEAPRPVGAGFLLQPTGLHVLDDLGLTDEVAALGQPVARLFGRAAPTYRTVLDVRYADLKQPRAALGVHRAALFEVLYGACLAAGVGFETGFAAVGANDGRLTDAKGRSSPQFDLVIDASGARSPIAEGLEGPRRPLTFGALWATVPWADGAGFDATALEQVYRRADTMIGVLPCGRRPGSDQRLATIFWSLKGRDHDAWRAGGLDAWKAAVLGFWPEMDPLLNAITAPGDLTLAHYAHCTLQRPYGDRLAVIGDAAHSTSPQLGQGVNMGLLDAFALAEALARTDDLTIALPAYAAARRWHVRLYQALSWAFTPFYQADGRVLPWVRDHVLGRAARLPVAPRLLAATVSGLLLDPR